MRDVVDQALLVGRNKGYFAASASGDHTGNRRGGRICDAAAFACSRGKCFEAHKPGWRCLLVPDCLAGGHCLSVDDNGEGIRPDALAACFERFFEEYGTERRVGCRIGAPIAQSIAEAHGSEIAVESKFGARARGLPCFFGDEIDRLLCFWSHIFDEHYHSK